MKMEFWGVEVKPGEVLSCDLGDDKYLHLSQAALGEIKNAKENERVLLSVHDDNKKIVLGALTYGKCDQFSLDIVFSKPFKLSHSCTTGSVFFIGYTTIVEDADDGMGGYDDSDSDSEDDRQAQALMRRVKENGQKEVRLAKPDLTKEKPKEKPKERKSIPVKKPEEESIDEDDDEDDEDDDDEGMEGSSDDEDESDEEEGDSDDESDEGKNQKMPKAESVGKKRPLPDSSTKSPGIDKKAKMTPGGAQNQGTDGGKKGGPKTSVSKEQTPSNKGQTPKAVGAKEPPKPNTTPGSGKKVGQHVCNTCSRNFATESALTQHNAAKHGGK